MIRIGGCRKGAFILRKIPSTFPASVLTIFGLVVRGSFEVPQISSADSRVAPEMIIHNPTRSTHSSHDTLRKISCIFALLWSGVLCQSDPSPLSSTTNRVLLTVSGKINKKNHGETFVFDQVALDALNQRELKTSTPWHKGRPTFSGPLFSEVLDHVQAQGTNVIVTAINDYSSTIPIQDLRKWPIVLATRIDGKVIPIREKGPIFVIYPFDTFPETKNEVSFFRSVWQVKSLEVQ